MLQLPFQLSANPPGIAEGNQETARTAAFGNRVEYLERGRHRAQVSGLDRAVALPFERMQHKAALLLNRPAIQNRAIRRFARINVEILEQGM